ncbi:MAG TPA: hypothetical protein VF669_23070 [Tepidisphaeraceae bacterium]|jgi:hypothetical protein
MKTEQGQSDISYEDVRPYPQSWDLINGAVVSLIMLAATAAVLAWMVGVTFSTYR